MASSGNFSTMNPLHYTSTNVQYSNGNLTFSPNSSWSETTFTRNNMVIPKDKKIYFEVYYKTQSGYYAMHGLSAVNATPTSAQSGSTGTIIIYNDSTRINGTRTDGVVTAASQGDVIGIAIDGSNNKVWFAVNNTWQISGDPANGTNEIGTITTNDTVGHDITAAFNQNSVSSLTVNFGQDSTFGGEITAGGNADGNGFGDFKYAPPTGFLALSSANLSVSADIDPAQTDDDYPSKQFDTVLYTGNASTNNISNLNFKPDLVWIKIRNTASNAVLVDSSRGTNKMVHPNHPQAEVTTANLTSFNSDGFSLDGTSDYQANYNGNSNTYVAWCWRANGGTEATNNDGTGTSYVQANQAAGFSITRYTGTGSALTVGHGLAQEPEFTIIKDRDASVNWIVYTKIIDGSLDYFFLNTTASKADSGLTGPNSSIWNFNSASSYSNTSSRNYIMYNWHSVEGYSKFGTYVGNYNTDGAFIYTGFRPRMLFVKRSDAVNSWFVWDTARTTSNKMNSYLYWDSSNAEETGYAIDVLSNGFKLRGQNNATNNSGGTFIYGAWGDVPFKYNNTF